jgi:hypothetical protein
LPVVSILGLAAAAFAGVAGGLVLGGCFAELITVTGDGHVYRLSGWTEQVTGSLARDQIRLGTGLAVAAVALLVAAGLIAWSVWRPARRTAAIGLTVGAVALMVAEFWTITSFLSDLESLAGSSGLHPSRGAGYWLLLTAVVLGCLAVVVVALTAIPLRLRPAVPAAPSPQWTAPPPVAGPPDWAADPASWGGAR